MKKKILVVDDSEPILELASTMLKLLGYEPIKASTGVEALKALKMEKPAMALLDVILPDMDGFKICQHIRSNTELAEMPVFMVSAKKTTEDMERGQKAGANEYVTKPFKSAEMAQLIKKYIGD
ncbi:Response regulator receiver domain-containing protein [Malonomonas rubra DSM 5091]|uniref:Response regulator receiver domain-containing protein n=1 Tax=Malonomonas rubra DSM 5091 TaxID=1122189 RepID=A0A1M6J733_MALRU|nr:response regulator [Malonomonas rubra]SHJ42460.1 Response regulator receiver domain-containing protein [Malonomonas rubra DSM 5091]